MNPLRRDLPRRMNVRHFKSDDPPAHGPDARKSKRVTTNAEITLRRRGHSNFRVNVYDLSRHGCKIDFVERPRTKDRVWVKFNDLEALEALVRWVDGFTGGVEFEKPLHPAVFDLLLKRMGRARS